MRIALLVVFAAILLVGGEWVYRSFLRPVDPLAPEVLSLAERFDRSGIKVRPYPVRHGFRHTEVLSAAAFEILGFPLPISVDLCPTDEAAAAHLAKIKTGPNLMHPSKNGRLVLYLPMWGDDTGVMATKVINAFSSY